MNRLPVNQATEMRATRIWINRARSRAAMIASPPAKVRSHARSVVSTASHRPPTSAATSSPAPIKYSLRRPRLVTPSRRHAVRRQPAFALGAIRREILGAGRLEAHHQHRLRVRGAQQTPSFGKRDAHAADFKKKYPVFTLDGVRITTSNFFS